MIKQKSSCIAIDCRMLGMSGIGVYIENIVPQLIHELSDCRFRLIGDKKKLNSLPIFFDGRVTFYPCDAPIYSIKEQFLVPKAARGANLLWVPHYNIPVFTTVPLLVTVHDVAHLVLPEVIKNPLRHAYARFVFATVRRKAKEILTVSQFTADEFIRHVGQPKGTINVVHNGVSDAWFEQQDTNQKGDAACSVPYFIAVGNLKSHKRIDFLCRAFSKVADRLPHKLILVGKYDGFISGAQRLSDLLSLAPGRIEAAGRIDDAKLRKLVCNADALVFPSCYEGFGLPPLEAMAAGVPVIVSDIPPVREVCGSFATYFSKDDQDSLQNVLLEFNEKKHLVRVAQAREHASTFKWNRTVCAIAQIIRQL